MSETDEPAEGHAIIIRAEADTPTLHEIADLIVWLRTTPARILYAGYNLKGQMHVNVRTAAERYFIITEGEPLPDGITWIDTDGEGRDDAGEIAGRIPGRSK